MSSLADTWERLSASGTMSDALVRLRLSDVPGCDTYAARQVSDGLEALVLEVATAAIPAQAEFPDARGLAVEMRVLEPGRAGRTRIILTPSEQRYRDVFRSLAEDVVSTVQQAPNEALAVEALVARLSRWQAFLRRHGPDSLSLESRRGLFGELHLLRHDLIPRCGAVAAVESWKGTSGASHDFQFATACVEVKTTSARTPHSFHVANIKQLDAPGQGPLLVYFVVLEESAAGDVALTELIDSLRTELGEPAIYAFEDRLVEAGYLEDRRDDYASPRYSVRHQRCFEVREGFPRLQEAQIPVGVEGVTYEVAVAAALPFARTPSEALDGILGPAERTE
jgi:hypothetical protein